MQKSNNQEPTTREIIETINEFSTNVDKRFEGIEQRLTRIETTMVTKDYLDDKLADLRGDLVVLVRKEDRKLVKLVDILKSHQLISEDEVKEVLSLEPFPQI